MQNTNHYLRKTAQSKQQLNASDMETTFLPPTTTHSATQQQQQQQQLPSAHSSHTPRVRIWLELGGPDGSGSVVVGQATTLTVRAIVPGTMGVRIVDCAALDGLGESTQQLLDERGCPIDEQVSREIFQFNLLLRKTIYSLTIFCLVCVCVCGSISIRK